MCVYYRPSAHHEPSPNSASVHSLPRSHDTLVVRAFLFFSLPPPLFWTDFSSVLNRVRPGPRFLCPNLTEPDRITTEHNLELREPFAFLCLNPNPTWRSSCKLKRWLTVLPCQAVVTVVTACLFILMCIVLRTLILNKKNLYTFPWVITNWHVG